jgi:hypothetical protein
MTSPGTPLVAHFTITSVTVSGSSTTIVCSAASTDTWSLPIAGYTDALGVVWAPTTQECSALSSAGGAITSMSVTFTLDYATSAYAVNDILAVTGSLAL